MVDPINLVSFMIIQLEFVTKKKVCMEVFMKISLATNLLDNVLNLCQILNLRGSPDFPAPARIIYHMLYFIKHSDDQNWFLRVLYKFR